MASTGPHGHRKPPQERPATEEELDKVEAHLKKLGCLDQHYEVLECIADKKDWRKCQEQVTNFRQCYSSAMAEAKKDGGK